MRPPAMARSAVLPLPPCTSLAASAISSPAFSPLSFVTAATSETPPPAGAEPSTTALTPAMSRTATARSFTSSRSAPSTRVTTYPFTAPSASDCASTRAAVFRSCSTSRSSTLRSSSSLAIRSGRSSAFTRSSPAAASRSDSSARRRSRVTRPVVASIRRRFEPIELSLTTLIMPI